MKRVSRTVAISEFTRSRFAEWAGNLARAAVIVPPSFDAGHFAPGPKSPELVSRYGISGRKVMLTVGRLSSVERYKGVDELLEVLPLLTATVPELVYLIVGDGDDRERLRAKAATLGVRDRVIFAGHIPEREKADHYRLADVFAMPGRGEGFGIVYLEAIACGIPVIASSLDASREAVQDGALGQVVDPDDPGALAAAITAALGRANRDVPHGLDYFSPLRFTSRWHAVLDAMIAHPKAVAKA